MMIQATLRSSGPMAVRALGALALLATLAGCSFGTMEMSGPESTSGTFSLQGRTYGGNNPDVGATIQVWAAGTTGYGAGATQISTGSITTDSHGFFSLTGSYSCSSPSTPVYVTATGGNPGAGTNPAIRFVSAFATCGTLQSASYVWINEVTTAAAAYALTQYSNTGSNLQATDSIGAPNRTQAQQGLANAFSLVATLVNSTNGTAVTSNTLSAAHNVTITVTPEAAKLYTIANILAACANSTNGVTSPCQTTLFPDVTPNGGTAPTDTYQAAVMMNLNPALNVNALYGLQNANSPYVTNNLASAPTDWTLGVQYQDTSSTPIMNKPQNVAIDGYGNAYILSNSGNFGSLVELGPTGTVLANVNTLHTYGPWTSASTGPFNSPTGFSTSTGAFQYSDQVFTNYFGATTTSGTNSNPGINPKSLAIDPSNNVWFTSTGGIVDATSGVKVSAAVFEVATSNGVPTGTTYGISTNKSETGITIDSTGNVFTGSTSSSAYFEMFEFPYNSTPGQALLSPIGFTFPSTTPGTAGTANTYLPNYMAVDQHDNLWFTSGSSAGSGTIWELGNLNTSPSSLTEHGVTGNCTPAAGVLCQASTSTSVNTYYVNSLTGGVTSANQISVDAANVYLPDSAGATGVTITPISNPSSNTVTGTTATFTAPSMTALDGKGYIWVANNNATPAGTNPTPGGSVSEMTSTGTVLSPSTSSTTTTNPGFVHAGISNASSIAVDISGNVWVTDNVAYNSTTPATNQSAVFEIIGAAFPVVTPIAAGLAGTWPSRP